MAPIDPNALLQAFEPWLTPEGGIKNNDEVPRLSSLMKKYSKKLVSRCIYLNVLMNTKEEVLNRFLDQDGWETVNSWLNLAKEASTTPFLLELIKLLERCPVSVERLKQTNTARVIKLLSKEGEGNVAIEAKKLVDKWTSFIRESKIDAEKNKKPKRKDSVTRQNSESDDSNSSSKRRKLEEKNSNGAVSDSNLTREESNARLLNATSRPTTTRVKQNTMRSVGIELPTDQSSNSAKSKPSYKVSNTTVSSNENKVAPIKLKLSPTKKGGIQVIEALPLQNGVVANGAATARGKIKESAFLVDAIASEITPIRKTKKKPLPPSSKEATKIVTNNVQVTTDADPADEVSKQIEIEMQTSIAPEDTTDDTYQEPLIEPDQDLSIDVSQTSPPVKSKPSPPQVTPSTGSLTTASTPTTLTPGPSKSFPRGCLRYTSSSKKKKIRWLPDEAIVAVKFFELDDGERTNVFRDALDKKAEANAFRQRNFGMPVSHKPPPVEYCRWTMMPLTFPQDYLIIEKGKDSKERDLQAHHQKQSAVFYNFNSDFPSEPDQFEALASAYETPKTIPLDDPANPTPVNDYSGNVYTRPYEPSAGQSRMMPIGSSAPAPRSNQPYGQQQAHHNNQSRAGSSRWNSWHGNANVISSYNYNFNTD
ncbi:Serine/threonine-protein phosphatase 1 regulatory subunit 10 [Halotydeus destructor]|nr:Serine/threonine-protein phosphatase 1 regulatory subunit 10 [Halotydeus destructor]